MLRLLLAALVAGPVSGQEPPRHHGQHGNPSDLRAYIEGLESPERAEWQKPDDVVSTLGLGAGATACDIGAGPGYFTLRLAEAVGEHGRVFAVDVEPAILRTLEARVARAGLANVTTVLGHPEDPLLPDAACDLVLVVNTYHHFPDGPAYLERLLRSLKPDGRVANIDFVKRQTPVGPPLGQRVARETFLDHAAQAGLALESDPDFLPYQYFLILVRRSP